MYKGGKYEKKEDGRVYFFFQHLGNPTGAFHEVGCMTIIRKMLNSIKYFFLHLSFFFNIQE